MSLKVSCSALVEVDSRILMVGEQQRGEILFTLPGGTLEHGEDVLGCCMRETEEETGLVIEAVGLVGRYSSLRANAKSNIIRLVFAAEAVGGMLTISDKRPVVGFYDQEQLDYLQAQDQIKPNATLQAIHHFRQGQLFPLNNVQFLDRLRLGRKHPKSLAS